MIQHDTGVKAVLSRMKQLFGVEKDAELARALDISPQTLSSWRQRSAVPYALCVDCAKSQGASLDWLLYGEGEMMRESTINTPEAKTGSAPRSRESLKARLIETLEGLATDDLEDLLNDATKRQRLRELEKRFEHLQSHFFETTQRAV
ncbi:bacteriophage CI repressor-like protein [Marinobacter pelagius]|uniref:Bacteriophage CI repressor-like protein n=1 Tax=Marinobacter pelagius TaxID=379482 RepID=A0A366GSF5_9GAMM|nr:helix-turn-helix domain-containing protein [Marinobacter pelagius]RBP30018.1 bacteriophage CI repressor-like protein [Marinobacter pelagius]